MSKRKLEYPTKKIVGVPKFKPSISRPSLGATQKNAFHFGELLKGKVDSMWASNKASMGKTQVKQNLKHNTVQSPTFTTTKKIPNVSSVRNLNFNKMPVHPKKKAEQRNSDIKIIVHKL